MDMRIENGNLILAEGNDSTLIPLDVLAAWKQLVACADDVEAVAAILAHKDPGMYQDGSTAFTPAYRELDRQALLDRNQESRAARVRAISPMGALVADGRMETRRLLGLSTVQTLTLAMVDETGQSDERTIPLPENIDADKLAELLAEPDTQALIRQGETDFLAQFTPRQ